ncbi:MAG: type II toxin-antitoxin system VapC family toxin [Campylobacterota bacterium]|nr:type II toxin-antitoxin system VapC family toxin [Campylobacterota bacterium]
MGSVSENLFSQSPNNIVVPSIVIYELEVGIAKSNNPNKRVQQLSELLQQVNILDFTQNEAKESAKIRADLEKGGTPIGSIDVLIAGCAKANNLILITRNLKEFERVAHLKLENWY